VISIHHAGTHTHIYNYYVIVISQYEYDILVITGVQAKLRTSFNNEDIISIYMNVATWDITFLYPKGLY